MTENTKHALGELAFVITLAGFLIGGIGYVTGNIGRTPKAGEVWKSSLECSPWEKADTVIVLEVKKGWVRYDMPRFSLTNFSTLSSFRVLYKKYNEPK